MCFDNPLHFHEDTENFIGCQGWFASTDDYKSAEFGQDLCLTPLALRCLYLFFFATGYHSGTIPFLRR